MSIAGTYPEKGIRIALDLRALEETRACYDGFAYTPWARHALDLAIDRATGNATLHVGAITARDDGQAPPSSMEPPASLPSSELAFIRQVGKQLWRLATQTKPEDGGGSFPRRVQRWRGPK